MFPFCAQEADHPSCQSGSGIKPCLVRKSGIGIQDIPLARLLYRKVKVGGPVPQETYKAVAAVLAVVFRMTRRGPAADEARP